MKLLINGKTTMTTKYTLEEIAKKIQEKEIGFDEDSGIINWGNVCTISILKK